MPDDLPLASARGRLSVSAASGAAGTSGNAWETTVRRWDLLYGLVFLADLLAVASSTAPDRRVLAVTALAAMAPWYLLVGRPHLITAQGELTTRAVIFMVGVVALFSVSDLQAPNTWFLAVALLPLCYSVLPERVALIPALAMNAVGAASVAYWSGTLRGDITAAALAIGVSAFTVAFGRYIGRIITQSGERASLIAQLEATRAELAEVSRQAGVMAERQRLAGEIHDTLAQGFSSILMLIQAAEAQLELSPATARRQLGLAAQTARENLAEARTLVGDLASAQLQAGTLEDALRRITERTSAELGLQARFATDGTSRLLPAATEVVLLRTGQEALANVRKHAAARNVSVRLCYASDRVRLEVTDDGAGFDPAVVNGGYGLRGMRARVAEAGGTIAVRSAPEEGTSVQVEVPG
ncbi:MAG TPA: sensor histidine kinase [Streptosporangiaceae bacterium]|nr:sensor histidine kinase [Streptosporangiaceae bacterium]